MRKTCMHAFISPLPSQYCNFPNHKLRNRRSSDLAACGRQLTFKKINEQELNGKCKERIQTELAQLLLSTSSCLHRRPGRSTPKLQATLGLSALAGLGLLCRCLLSREHAACAPVPRAGRCDWLPDTRAEGRAAGRPLAWQRSSAASAGR